MDGMWWFRNSCYARALGVPAIDGVNYFADLERANDGWHSTKTDANHAIYTTLYEEARSVAYPIAPTAPTGQLGPHHEYT